MGFRNWATKKVTNLGQSTVVEPVKKDVEDAKNDMSEKLGLATNVIRFLLCAIIGTVMLRDAGENQNANNTVNLPEPHHITINNYINEGGHGHDQESGKNQ